MNQKIKRAFGVAAFAVCMQCLAVTTVAQMGTQKDGLRRLAKLAVHISGDSSIMNDSQLRTQVELRLRRAGVPLNDECKPASVCIPQIHVELRAVKMNDRITYFWITVQCNIVVAPVNEPERRLLATVWISEESGLALNNDTDPVREKITQLIDEFANDYFAANPKS